MKRVLLICLCCGTAALVALSILAGCGNKNPGPDPVKITNETTDAEVTAEETEKETTANDDEPDDVDDKPTEFEESGNIADLYYQTVPASSDSGSSNRGFYVFDQEDEEFPYKILIAAGEFSTGGYDIEITDVQYDGTEVIIVVKETSPGPTDMVTEAFTYPCCGIELSLLPESVKVVDQGGNEFKCLYIYLSETEIKDGWIACLSGGAGEITYKTYVYETDDGRYEYVNTTCTTESWGSSKWNEVIDGSGTADTREEIADIAEEHGSAEFVQLIDDKSIYTIDEFIEGKMF